LQKALGWPINLFAFDASELRTAGHTRDTMMAENITLVAARDSHDNSVITLVLAGNWHASRAPRHGSSDDPAGMYLNMPSVIAFDMIPSGGTAWQMSGGRGGEREVGQCVESTGMPVFRARGTQPNGSISYVADGYDGIIDVGCVTASPPANRTCQ